MPRPTSRKRGAEPPGSLDRARWQWREAELAAACRSMRVAALPAALLARLEQACRVYAVQCQSAGITERQRAGALARAARSARELHATVDGFDPDLSLQVRRAYGAVRAADGASARARLAAAGEMLDGLATALALAAARTDPGRRGGRPANPAKAGFVLALAQLWHAATGKLPTRRSRVGEGHAAYGPFHDFVTLAVAKAAAARRPPAVAYAIQRALATMKKTPPGATA